jgi:hypothetical protein
MRPADQVRKMVQPLLQRHADLAFHRLSIVVMPVRHLVRRVMIDRTGGPDLRSVTSHVGFLCQPDGVLGGRANPIYPPAKGGGWRLWDPLMAEKLFEQIEPSVLDELRAIRTLDDYADFLHCGVPSPVVYRYHLGYLVVAVARGDLKTAAIMCKALETGQSRFADPDLADYAAPIIDRLYPLIQARDRAGLAAVLREYEELTVKESGLEHLWEPTPFTLELLPTD